MSSAGGYQPPGDEPSSAVASASPSSQIMSMAIQRQDSLIDELAVGVSRLRDQSHLIGDEAALQVNLLSDMESNIDTAHDQLGNQARQATRLLNEVALWKLQLIVAGLTISFFFLIVLKTM
jgi:hypothetical protein